MWAVATQSRPSVRYIKYNHSLRVVLSGGADRVHAGQNDGSSSGQPIGLRFVSGTLGEPELMAAACAVEQATQARIAPDLDAVMESFEGLGMAQPMVE